MDNLARDAFLARQNKMSYGQYMAKFKPPKEPVKKKPIDHMYICFERKEEQEILQFILR